MISAGSRREIESVKILNIVYSKPIISKSYRRLYKKYIFIKDIILLKKDILLEALLIASIIVAFIKVLLEASLEYNSL